MTTQQPAFYQKITDICLQIMFAKPLLLTTLLLLMLACGPERRDDLQDSGKVSVSDSTHNGKSGDKGVGQEGKGYASEGQQDVVSGTDSAHSAANANPKTDTTTKK
jgi:hypothetical protein